MTTPNRYVPPELPANSLLDLTDYLEMFGAVGHELRYRILRTLLRDGTLNANALQDAVGARANTFHYHLDILEEAGLVTNRKRSERGAEGVYSYYEATPFAERLLRAMGNLIEEERRRTGGGDTDSTASGQRSQGTSSGRNR